MPSFSVRCIFCWKSRPDQRRKHLYEERITLWVANNIDEAIEFAEKEAATYAEDGEEYLRFCQAYEMSESIDGSGIEVFSLLRESDLDPMEYIDMFFCTGEEHERTA
jgi:hypothetical protein